MFDSSAIVSTSMFLLILPAETLLYAILTSSVDYCNSAPKMVTELQQVLNSVARWITNNTSTAMDCYSNFTKICTGWMYSSCEISRVRAMLLMGDLFCYMSIYC